MKTSGLFFFALVALIGIVIQPSSADEKSSTDASSSLVSKPIAERRSSNPPAASAALPVRRVTLFTSGVAYTERGGAVEGDASVPLTFRTAQINDILKSMVLLDETGRVQPATYAAKDPIGRTLQSFAVDVTNNLSQQSILAQL